MKYCIFSIGLTLLISSTAFAKPHPSKKTLKRLEAKLEQLQRELEHRPRDVSTYRLPKTLKFCGTKIDLENPVIRDRLEHEFYLILGDRAQVVLWARRAQRVFPPMERTIKRRKMCDDLKYVAVAESGLRPAVTSHASAKGWWQFMAPTARDFGLKVGRSWDERADLGQSTSAGLRYLEELRNQFGTWPLALAAYNTGPGRLRRAIKDQGIKDYWRLMLINEAERYVPRIVMIKEVLGNAERYGFHLNGLHS
ncbi:MAG: lytic transglycosylase domain-containing protein, partial [Myxococcota bacterium]|nr:lytic transglycosylase domain-containing protein [Myxococcota bacterium]